MPITTVLRYDGNRVLLSFIKEIAYNVYQLLNRTYTQPDHT